MKILYELPDDSEESEVSQPIPQRQKRQNDGKNMQFSKKLKKDKPNNKDEKNKGKEKFKTDGQPSNSERFKHDCTNLDSEDTENYNMDSSEIFDNHKRIAKPVRRLTKGRDNKKLTHIGNHDKTNTFKGLTVIASTSEGALADVEDNADSQSNDDISDEQDKNSQVPIYSNTNTIPTKLVQDRESISSSKQSVDGDKESASKNQIKTENSSPRVVSESNTSQPTGGKGGKASTSSTTNQSKLKSDDERRKKRKCFVCNKKLGLTAITCRCGGLYCSQHRYDKEHDCKFDYKSMGAEEIRKNNPLIVAEKISKL